MKSDELELWNKIKSFQFDKPNIRLTFAKCLAKENDISLDFANKIVDEYRKFIFLCCTSKQEVSPSHWVDQAWHLHLTYTRSYWVDLCKNTINRDLHHNPTEGGQEEDQKFENLYKDTLDLYRSYFSTNAPSDVWPHKNHAPRPAVFEIDKIKNWIIRKPDFGFHERRNSFSIIGVILLALLLGCTSYAGSVPLILVFIVIVAITVWVFRKNRQTSGDCSSGCGSSGCGGGGGETHSHSDGTDSHGSADSSDGGGGGDSGCSSSGCSGGCGGGGD